MFHADLFDNNLKDAALCCAQVALQLSSLKLSADDVTLSVHCGMGCGTVVSYQVGGIQGRWEYVIAGDPVAQIGHAENLADSGELVLSNQAYTLLKDHVRGQEILPSMNFLLYEITKRKAFPNQNSITDTLHDLMVTQPAQSDQIIRAMRCYVPRPVLWSIEQNSGNSLWSAELRVCSTLFCKINGLAFDQENGLERVQQVVRDIVQKAVILYNGTMCRFIVDDKGAVLLLAYGLPPFMHENDAVRAVKTALMICYEIELLNQSDSSANISAAIGITRGKVCCGTVGGAIRCEYTLHGVLVNLAARFMQKANDHADHKTNQSLIYCDQETYVQSEEEVEFGDAIQEHVKGKLGMVAMYRAHSKKLRLMLGKTLVGGRRGSISMDRPRSITTDSFVGNFVSSEIVDNDSRSVHNSHPDEGRKHKKDPLEGRDESKLLINEWLYKSLMNRTPWSGILAIEGDVGIGKSVICQYAWRQANKNKLLYLAGYGLDTESTNPLFVWQQILVQLLVFYGTTQNGPWNDDLFADLEADAFLTEESSSEDEEENDYSDDEVEGDGKEPSNFLMRGGRMRNFSITSSPRIGLNSGTRLLKSPLSMSRRMVS